MRCQTNWHAELEQIFSQINELQCTLRAIRSEEVDGIEL